MKGAPPPLARALGPARRRLGLRLATLIGAVGGGTWAVVAMPTGGWALAAVAAGLAVWAVAGVVRAAEKPTRDVLGVLEGIRYDDLSLPRVREGEGPLLAALGEALRGVTESVRTVRAEREREATTLEIVVRHVGVALVAFRPDGTVTLFNLAARRLFEMPRPRTLGVLGERAPDAAGALAALREGDRVLIRLGAPERPREVIAHATRFVLAGEPTTLVSLQDIREELEARELEAWQQLSRVLTHEITNSVAPIASLAATARGLLDADGGGADVAEALGTIERRSRRLVAFVDAYRTLARLPAPVPRPIDAAELLGDVAMLTRASAPGVAVEVEVTPPGLTFLADPDLVEQALVNLALNAAEALRSADRPGRVVLRARDGTDGRPVVEVADDGPGLLSEVQERAFVPFFSTKPDGSGIGLTLSQRIARLHGGALTVRSEPDVETVFTMRL